jgi:hypothetical protein
MKIYRLGSGGVGLSVTEAQDGLLFEDVTRQGTTEATATPGSTSSFPWGYARMSILAHYVDASNYAVALPSNLDLGVQEITVWADASSGSSITISLPSGDTFVGSATSATIDGGRGKIFTRIEGYPSRVWAYIG